MKIRSKSTPHLMVCGGGTGGHFFSGLALAEKFLELYPSGRITFVGTRLGIEGRTELSDARMSIFFIHARGLKGKSWGAKFRGVLSLSRGFLESLFLLAQRRPHLVAGVGGYASAPTLVAAVLCRWLFRWRVFVLEQNSSAGLVNRVLAKGPLSAYAAFSIRGFQLVDLPLRSSFLRERAALRDFEWPPKRVLIVGGSQGARGLNDCWLKTLSQLKQLSAETEFVHQTGTQDLERVQRAYRELGLKATVIDFTTELPRLLNQADLVVSRAGAMTVFEVMAFRRPAIFVPFPQAADDHQTKNALAVQDPQWVIAESQWTWDRLESLWRGPPSLLRRRGDLKPILWEEILS